MLPTCKGRTRAKGKKGCDMKSPGAQKEGAGAITHKKRKAKDESNYPAGKKGEHRSGTARSYRLKVRNAWWRRDRGGGRSLG